MKKFNSILLAVLLSMAFAFAGGPHGKHKPKTDDSKKKKEE